MSTSVEASRFAVSHFTPERPPSLPVVQLSACGANPKPMVVWKAVASLEGMISQPDFAIFEIVDGYEADVHAVIFDLRLRCWCPHD